MELDQDALKNFQNSKFDFVDADGKDVDYNNLSDDGKYTFRDGKTVIEDNMKAANVVATIDNEFGKDENI